MATTTISAAQLRAWWASRQGLDGSAHSTEAASVLTRTGWARSVGGAGPYLTLFARAGVSRETADADVAGLRIHELPSARGCTYVVPAAEFALALRLASATCDAEMNVARKLGVTDTEVDKLCDKIVSALARETLDPEQIKAAVGAAVRNLGEEGKKKGLITTLPLALGRMQQEGRIRRVPTNGRLDQQRYRYTLWKPNPLDKFKASFDECFTELARRYWSWIGPATIAEFAAFSGLGVKAAKDAAAPLKLVPMETDSTRLIRPEDLDALRAQKVPKSPQYALVSSLDSLTLLRRNLRDLLDPADFERQAFVEKDSRAMSGLADLPSHGIFDRGRLIGLWEFDPETGTIAWTSWVKPDKALKDAVARMEQYVKTDLGDARSFSLDSPKSRAPRIAAIRKAGA